MSARTRSRLLGALAAVAATLAIVACGGSSDSAPGPAPSAPPAGAPSASGTTPLAAPAPTGTPSTLTDAGDFVLTIADPQDPANQEAAEALVGSGVYQGLVDQLNAELALPHDIEIAFNEDGDGGPFYSPDTRRITYQYQFDRLSGELLARAGTPAAELDRRTRQGGVYVFFHELGHALIDAYDLPVIGREEDAADGLASVMAISVFGNPEIALSGAGIFAGLATTRQPGSELSQFADEHTIDPARVLNIACLVYGSNPEAYGEFAEAIGLSADDDRLARCPGEYEQAVTSWNTLLAPYRLGGTTPPATGPATPTVPATVPTTATVPTEPTTAPTDPGSAAPQEQLLATIPEATRSSCVTSDPGELQPGAVASVTCDLTATVGHTAVYQLFPDAESMNAVYQQGVASAGATPDQGDCNSSPPAEGPWEAGRVVCGPGESGTAGVAWTHDTLFVLTIARREDGDLPTLFQWFAGPDSGPVG